MTNREALVLAHKVQRKTLEINQKLELIEQEKPNEMVDPKVAALITEFDAATDAIAARIQRIIDNGSLNADSETALKSEVAKLQALGKDPEAPIPVGTV